MDSLRRDLTVDEEEKTEATVNEFIAGMSDRELNLSTKEEMCHCMKYMKHLLLEKESKYGQEIVSLKEQINDLKKKLGEYLAKENNSSLFKPNNINKENSGESPTGAQATYPLQMELRTLSDNETFGMKKKKNAL